LKKEMFGYLPGGYGRMLKSFGGQLSELGVKVRLNENVATVRRENNAVQIRSEDGSLIGVFDRAVATVPSRLISRIMPELSPLERQQHESIQYQGIVCVSLLLKKPLADFYVTNITDAVVPFTGVIEMSALVDRTEFGGRSLIYLPYYVPENDKLFDVSDDEIQETSLSGLEAMYPEFKRSDVVACRASRVRRVMPIPTLNYSENVPPMATSIPGVYAVNSVQIVNGTLNVNETVKLAETATANLLLLDQPSENCPKENQHAAAC
jgi:protoporphyrinogen oxidase